MSLKFFQKMKCAETGRARRGKFGRCVWTLDFWDEAGRSEDVVRIKRRFDAAEHGEDLGRRSPNVDVAFELGGTPGEHGAGGLFGAKIEDRSGD